MVTDNTKLLALRVADLEAGMAETVADLAKATEEPTRLQKCIDEARKQRGDAVARGQDLGTISRTIKKLKEDLELAEDSVVGLIEKRNRLMEDLDQARADLREAHEDANFERLAELVREYNHLAREMAPLVAEILFLRGSLRHSKRYHGGCQVNVRLNGWEQSALESIPVLYISGEERPPFDCATSSFFKAMVNRQCVINGETVSMRDFQDVPKGQ